MRKKNIVLCAGAAVILVGIIAASFILKKLGSSERSRSHELATDRKEETTLDERNTTERQEKDEGKEVLDVYCLGYLYYLDPDSDQEFKERLTTFVKDSKLSAYSVRVLEDYVDDRDDEKEPAFFYLKLDDEEGTILLVSFDKTSGRYTFAVSDGDDPVTDDAGDKSEGRTEYEIPENSEDEPVPAVPVTIADNEDALAGAADMDQLGSELASWLISIDEGRRNLFVNSFGLTEEGYEAVLDFSSVRHDGRNVEVKYDGTYHFRLV